MKSYEKRKKLQSNDYLCTLRLDRDENMSPHVSQINGDLSVDPLGVCRLLPLRKGLSTSIKPGQLC